MGASLGWKVMTDEKALFDAVQAAEEAIYWVKRYLETSDREIKEILVEAIEEFERSKP